MYFLALIGVSLAHTSFPTNAALPRPYAHGYVGPDPTTGRRATADVTFSNPLVTWTAGALISTVPEMLKYDQELGTGAGLPARLWRLRRSWGALTKTGPRLQYGLGLTRLGDWIGHDGSVFGYSDLVFYLPARRASVVGMANAADGETVPAQKVRARSSKLCTREYCPIGHETGTSGRERVSSGALGSG